jgi:hypothetical protein
VSEEQLYLVRQQPATPYVMHKLRTERQVIYRNFEMKETSSLSWLNNWKKKGGKITCTISDAAKQSK